MLRKQLSIEDQGGIQQYLDDTKARHNGHDFTAFLALQKAKVPKAAQARLLGVSTKTVQDWLRRIEASQEKQNG